jgi:hypothetical protein
VAISSGSIFSRCWSCDQQLLFLFSLTLASYNFHHYPQFFTATILEWKLLPKPDDYNQIIIYSLLFLKKEESTVVNAFVPIAIGMPNHIHLIWHILYCYSVQAHPGWRDKITPSAGADCYKKLLPDKAANLAPGMAIFYLCQF